MKEATGRMSAPEYIRNGDYLIPNLTLREVVPTGLGRYARLRKAYLQEHRPILWNQLILSEQLYPHLQEVDRTAQARMGQLTRQLAEEAGATERLKEHDPMLWVQLMNLCKAQAEETVLSELVYQ